MPARCCRGRGRPSSTQQNPQMPSDKRAVREESAPAVLQLCPRLKTARTARPRSSPTLTSPPPAHTGAIPQPPRSRQCSPTAGHLHLSSTLSCYCFWPGGQLWAAQVCWPHQPHRAWSDPPIPHVQSRGSHLSTAPPCTHLLPRQCPSSFQSCLVPSHWAELAPSPPRKQRVPPQGGSSPRSALPDTCLFALSPLEHNSAWARGAIPVPEPDLEEVLGSRRSASAKLTIFPAAPGQVPSVRGATHPNSLPPFLTLSCRWLSPTYPSLVPTSGQAHKKAQMAPLSVPGMSSNPARASLTPDHH